MTELEIKLQAEDFDLETQYCDPADCNHDCMQDGVNNCDAVLTGLS